MLNDRGLDPKNPPMARAVYLIWRLIEGGLGVALLTFSYYLTYHEELDRNEKIGWSMGPRLELRLLQQGGLSTGSCAP